MEADRVWRARSAGLVYPGDMTAPLQTQPQSLWLNSYARADRMSERKHPHADATYRVVPTKDKAFAVEVSIPEMHPATVSPFATKADAEAWIAEHRRRVQAGYNPKRRFRGGKKEADHRGLGGLPAGDDQIADA
jgi:hypothetical protein